jgi:negative regulator of flagellin synthesis FlgM
MTDAISQYGRLAQSDAGVRSTLDKLSKKPGHSLAAAESPSRPAGPGEDSVTLSKVQEKMDAEPDFDRAKVESIKQAIAQGQYPLDSRRIAENFVALERMIRD